MFKLRRSLALLDIVRYIAILVIDVFMGVMY